MIGRVIKNIIPIIAPKRNINTYVGMCRSFISRAILSNSFGSVFLVMIR
jgi:hypothetical protein